MVARRFRRPALALIVIALAAVVAALVAGQIVTRDSAATAASAGEGNMPVALAKHLAKLHHASGATFAPPNSSNYLEGDQAAQDAADAERAIPGNDIPAAALQQSVWDWSRYSGRGAEGTATWQPLGPTNAKGLPNPYRDRSVYTAGTPNFSGRTVAEVIDPNCGSHGGGNGFNNNNGDGSCRLWIANANGGIWRTDNALSPNPQWQYLSRVFQHNNTASIVLDPNDRSNNTLWVGTGEPNACGSGCEAGVGLYKSTDGGNHWSGPYGQSSFYDRAVGSIAVQPGNSRVIFAASGRAIRGLSAACCGGVDALIPGAPHFGLYRSKDGGRSWELVNQGAAALCTASTPDDVSRNLTACSARGARRVEVDPVDPHTVYASFFGRGIWRSNSDGDVGTWVQIYGGQEPVQANRNERDEFDVVKLATGTTRMYVGAGGGSLSAKLFRSDDVRTGTPVFTQMSGSGDTPQASSRGYCDGQCSYDNYVFAPAAHFPNSGADPDTVYLSGSEVYSENNWGPASVHCCPDNPATGRSNGRAVILSTDGGATFTDMTDDKSDPIYPVELHPDHHGLTVNPTNYKQFFDVSDGGVTRSNGVFVDQSSYCGDPNVKGYTGTKLTFCQSVLSRTPEKLQPINPGLRTLHFYKLNYAPYNPSLIVAGAQDNGSWEIGDIQGSGTNSSATVPNSTGPAPTNCRTDTGNGNGGDDGHDDHNSSQNQVWVQINIADGGQNNFDIGDPCFRQSTWQSGQLMVSYAPKNQVDMNWIGDTLLGPYGDEAPAMFEAASINDPVTAHWLWTGREHLFRSENQGRNPVFTKEQHRQFCNVWYGTFAQTDAAGNYIPCDDWQPLGDPSPAGRLTGPAYGADKSLIGNGTTIPDTDYISAVQRSRRDTSTIWAATAGGRVFVSKNADATDPTAVVFDRIDNDPTAGATPPRFVTAIAVDPNDANHAIVTFSGFNAKTPSTPGHVFDVHYKPNASTWTLLDGNQPRDQLGDIPATSVALTAAGTIYVGTDYGVVTSTGNGVWKQAGDGLPALVAADMMYVPETQKIYVATHGQGVWSLAVDGIESRHQHDRGHGGGH